MSVQLNCDLRSSIGGARDQGRRPTCVAFAFSDAHSASRKHTNFLSAEYLFFFASKRMANHTPNSGINIKAAAEALLVEGQPYELDWPYQMHTPASGLPTPPNGLKLFRSESSGSKICFSEICASLIKGHPVVLLLRLTKGFYTPDAHGIIVYSNGDLAIRRHAVLAIGSGIRLGKEYVLVRNSWGQTWGLGGHAFIEQKYVEDYAFGAATIN
jgi:hypothetical protein